MLNELKTSLQFDYITPKVKGYAGQNVRYSKKIAGHELDIYFEFQDEKVEVSFTIDDKEDRHGIIDPFYQHDDKEDRIDPNIRYTVYALLEKALHDFMPKYQPKQMYITAMDAQDKQKIKLFDRMAWKFAKQYDYAIDKTKLAGAIIYYFNKKNQK